LQTLTEAVGRLELSFSQGVTDKGGVLSNRPLEKKRGGEKTRRGGSVHAVGLVTFFISKIRWGGGGGISATGNKEGGDHWKVVAWGKRKKKKGVRITARVLAKSRKNGGRGLTPCS